MKGGFRILDTSLFMSKLEVWIYVQHEEFTALFLIIVLCRAHKCLINQSRIYGETKMNMCFSNFMYAKKVLTLTSLLILVLLHNFFAFGNCKLVLI